MQTNKRYNKQVEEILRLEKDNKIFCIRPSKGIKIGRMEKDERTILKQYNLGREDYSNIREELKKYLKKK